MVVRQQEGGVQYLCRSALLDAGLDGATRSGHCPRRPPVEPQIGHDLGDGLAGRRAFARYPPAQVAGASQQRRQWQAELAGQVVRLRVARQRRGWAGDVRQRAVAMGCGYSGGVAGRQSEAGA